MGDRSYSMSNVVDMDNTNSKNYYFTNEYKIGKRGKFSLLQEPFDSPLAE